MTFPNLHEALIDGWIPIGKLGAITSSETPDDEVYRPAANAILKASLLQARGEFPKEGFEIPDLPGHKIGLIAAIDIVLCEKDPHEHEMVVVLPK